MGVCCHNVSDEANSWVEITRSLSVTRNSLILRLSLNSSLTTWFCFFVKYFSKFLYVLSIQATIFVKFHQQKDIDVRQTFKVKGQHHISTFCSNNDGTNAITFV